MENKIGKTKSCIHLYLNVHLLIFKSNFNYRDKMKLSFFLL